MVYNNIVVFILNLILKLTMFFFMILIGVDSSKVQSEKELIKRMEAEHIKSWIIFVIIIIAYWLIARYLLRPQESRIKNIISVSSIAIIGFFLGIINFTIYPKVEGVFSIVWLHGFILNTWRGNGFMASIPFILIPTLIIGLSIKKKTV